MAAQDSIVSRIFEESAADDRLRKRRTFLRMMLEEIRIIRRAGSRTSSHVNVIRIPDIAARRPAKVVFAHGAKNVIHDSPARLAANSSQRQKREGGTAD